MCEATKETISNKSDMIAALLNNNVYKMPDGRQFYEATEEELESILYSKSIHDHYC